jgi:hypothetical protein
MGCFVSSKPHFTHESPHPKLSNIRTSISKSSQNSVHLHIIIAMDLQAATHEQAHETRDRLLSQQVTLEFAFNNAIATANDQVSEWYFPSGT